MTASVDAKARRISYEYDNFGNMKKTTYPDGTFEEFTYDANGNNITAKDRSGLTVSMTYDKLDRMIEKKYADGNMTKELLKNVINYIVTLDANIYYQNEIIIPTMDNICNIIRKSNAYKYCNNPKKYLDELK